MYVGQENI